MRYYCTYFDKNYLAKAMALLTSLQRVQKGPYRIYAVCLDELSRVVMQQAQFDNVELVPLHCIEAGDEALSAARKERTLVEYYWTLTPTVISRVLDRNPAIDIITYLDADLFFYSSPEAIYAELGDKSILIHEHRYAPSLKSLENNGKYNVGLLCFRNDVFGNEAIEWWRQRCNEWCFFRYEDGKMGDQLYLNDWPQRFKQVVVLQNPGAGIAPWNHSQYAIVDDGAGSATVDGHSLVFYHFHALAFVSPTIIIPARHTHYPLNRAVIEHCFLPYLDTLHSSVERIRRIIPTYGFGLEERELLAEAHTFVAHQSAWEHIELVAPTQRNLFTLGPWRLYASAQMLGVAVATTAPAAKSPPLFQGAPPVPPLPRVTTPPPTPAPPLATAGAEATNKGIVQLWQEGREVRTSDDLLHELAGRPITDEIRVLYIIGAHLFQEQKLLFALFPNLQKVYLFEPIPSVVQRLRVMTADDPRVRVFGYAIADVNGPVDFHLTDNNGESSSLLHLGTHKQIFPWVHEAATITVEAHVLDAVVAFHQLPPPDMLFLDVQGAEYRILNTLSHTLREGLRLIYTECSTEEIYRGARVLEDVQALLSPQFGFAGFAPLMKQSPTHGNALFVKMEDAPLLVKKEAQTVAPTPQQGRPVPQQPLSGTSLLHEAVVFSREFIRLFEAADYEGAVEHYRSNRPRFKDTDPTIVQLDEIMLKVAANSSAEEH